MPQLHTTIPISFPDIFGFGMWKKFNNFMNVVDCGETSNDKNHQLVAL